MLDIRLIRSDPEAVRASLARRDPAAAQMVDTVLELDERWRGLTTELEQLRSEQNAASKALRGAQRARRPAPRRAGGGGACGGGRAPAGRGGGGGGGGPPPPRREDDAPA